MSDESVTVYRWRRNHREDVLATLSTFRGYRLADIRVYVADEGDEERPTRKGIAVRVEDLHHLRAAVEALVEAADEEGEEEKAA